jgi:flagellar motor switch protein FliN/FliY
MEEQNTPVETTENATNVPTKKDDPALVNSEVESSRPIEAVYDVPVIVSAVLGSAKMPVSDLLKLTRGSIVELERHLGDPVDIYVNNRLIAKGEVVSVDDRLAITMTEVIKIIK